MEFYSKRLEIINIFLINYEIIKFVVHSKVRVGYINREVDIHASR
jgi:hypothetical protein